MSGEHTSPCLQSFSAQVFAREERAQREHMFAPKTQGEHLPHFRRTNFHSLQGKDAWTDTSCVTSNSGKWNYRNVKQGASFSPFGVMESKNVSKRTRIIPGFGLGGLGSPVRHSGHYWEPRPQNSWTSLHNPSSCNANRQRGSQRGSPGGTEYGYVRANESTGYKSQLEEFLKGC
ncbi:hypothetical protein CYMTET_45700 [Cymbomonas tetramitiformis]|uniref:Uncharacterized protein n=1 Tax=Cymbomonas tetramitiformis TaxID=36881 RepID=A0AAE0BZ33_9CHLO|nr:hypothetical protein CYMTET_45700 [Cymbomonas tetramitiformis]